MIGLHLAHMAQDDLTHMTQLLHSASGAKIILEWNEL